MRPLHLAILRAARLLAPRSGREEWFAEWSAELCYVEHGATAFCLGAFRDAWWLRRNAPIPNIRHSFGLESPLRCLLFLTILAAVSLFFAFRLPGPDTRNLAMISAAGQNNTTVPSVTIEQYESLANHMRVAFYRPARLRVGSAELSIAMASANLFQLLRIPIPSAAPNSLILSQAAWRKYFNADPHIVGRVLEVAGQPAVVAAVLPTSSWRLPGRLDAWLLRAGLPPHTRGFVVVQLPASASGAQRFSAPNPQGGYDYFHCSSLSGEPPFLLVSLSMILFSFLLLPVITPLALGEYPPNRHLRRWIFLALKIALLLPIVCCGSLDLGLQPQGMLVGLIVAWRWALVDQRRRCPVCLRFLTNPIRIGDPARTFLDWYGAELICAQGHGLLYVPEIPTSCYSTQRWQYLDA